MNALIKDKVVLVFGGTGRVGSTTAKVMAAAGAQVVLQYNSNAKKAQAIVDEIVAAGGKAEAVSVNMMDRDDIFAFINGVAERYGRVDGLVNTLHNLTPVKDKYVMDLTWEDWQAHFTAIKAHFDICQAVIPIMRKQHFGRIVYISGGLAYRFYDTTSAFSCVKAGLNAFNKVLAREEGQNGITANIIGPGRVFIEGEDLIYGEDNTQKCALRRYCTPTDIANGALFYMSPLADGVTGQTSYISGGEIMPMP